MSKGNSGHFSGTAGQKANQSASYNSAKSSLVGTVKTINKQKNAHSTPMKGATPNSVTQNYVNGKLESERYYNERGEAYLDIDYSDHGNSKLHPNVPHQHEIKFKNGRPVRGEGKEIS
ncbi:hypothetical protein IK110_04190 [Candidatus Saccharibacteria bacterium]|nr:hypothetical protein [Candidatus Saccharibacteria bacterium]